MADIFISYAREDRSLAERLAKALAVQGWSVWWDPQIPAGKTFDEVIEQAIDEARSVLVLWSKHSVKSDWVRTEANEGLERNILIPVLVHDLRPPLAFRRIQAANLINWDGKTDHPDIKKLVRDISELLGPPPVVVEDRPASESEHAVEPLQEPAPERDVKAKVPEAPAKETQERGQSDISPAATTPSRRWAPLLGAGFLVLVVVLTWILGIREPTPETPPIPAGPITDAPDDPEVPSAPTESTSPEPAIPTTSETTTSDLQLSQIEWQAVQKALNDIGFDAGPNDGIPGAKTLSAIALYQKREGFPPNGKLDEGQYSRLLLDARLAAEGLLNSWLPEMIDIPGSNDFLIGSPNDEEGRYDDEGQHMVDIGDFKIGKYEVTVSEFKRFVQATKYRTDAEKDAGGKKGCKQLNEENGEYKDGVNWLNPGFEQGEEDPVVCLSWNDTQAYIKWLNDTVGGGYRLPTEAEWEYAARAGTRGPFSFESKINSEIVNYNAEHIYAGSKKGQFREKTVTVGSLPPNPWGLHEVHGNVYEWVCSVYDKAYQGSEKGCDIGNSDEKRVLRSGAWNDRPRYVRSADRFFDKPFKRSNNYGFRLAQDIDRERSN